MAKRAVLVALAASMLLVGAHEAVAQTVDSATCTLGIICIGGGDYAAPAPLLSAGVPPFIALGGGVIATWLYNKLRRR